ncbi:hypothetical protein GCM10009624_26910 [Gordonia sinesedis]
MAKSAGTLTYDCCSGTPGWRPNKLRIKKFAARTLVVALGGAGLILGFGLGSSDAQAGTSCYSANGQEMQRVVGNSGCGSRAGVGSTARAEETSGNGTAVAVSDNRGNATARNTQPGSTALAGANSGGTAYSVTTGPKALSMAQARSGGYAVSVGGWGGQAMSGPQGVACSGGFAAAVDTTTGKACVKSGSLDLRN